MNTHFQSIADIGRTAYQNHLERVAAERKALIASMRAAVTDTALDSMMATMADSINRKPLPMPLNPEPITTVDVVIQTKAMEEEAAEILGELIAKKRIDVACGRVMFAPGRGGAREITRPGQMKTIIWCVLNRRCVSLEVAALVLELAWTSESLVQ